MASDPNSKGRLRRWLARWWGPGLGGVVVALWGASGLTPDGHYNLLFWDDIGTAPTLLTAAVAVSVAGAIASARQVRQLSARADSADIAEGRANAAEHAVMMEIRGHLQGLLQMLGLYSEARTSLLLCQDDHFVLVGRYSPNPSLRRTSGRPTYPMNQGVIATSWRDGSAQDNELPNPGPMNAPPNKTWLEHQMRRHGVPNETACAFTMRSRSYAAIRLDDHERSLGVLIVETERPAADSPPASAAGGHPGASLKALEEASESTEVRSLTRLLGHIRQVDPHRTSSHLDEIMKL